MAGGGRRGRERVLESRHLVGLFLGVVILCAVFFTLGYVMGHNQYGAVHAAEVIDRTLSPTRIPPKAAEPKAAPAPVPANNEWDFYSKNRNNALEPAPKNGAAPAAFASGPKAVAVPPAPGSNARSVPASARFQAPRMAKGTVLLQVAALRREGDALALADALQQKNFPSFVVTPTTDGFYRVQVGPYPDQRAAESARSALDHAGFKAIMKR